MTQRAFERACAALFYLYPPSFRREHGREMRQFLRTAARDRATTRPFHILGDLLRAAPREWIEHLSPQGRRAEAHTTPPSREPMNTLVQDLRHAVRMLGKSPGFTAAAVVTLALGIGANTAIFSLAEATLLRPIKVRDPANLVVFTWSSSVPDFREYQARSDVFSGTTATGGVSRMNVTVGGQTELLIGSFAAGNLFDVLGVAPAQGRLLQSSDDVPGAAPVAVVSHAYWQARLGAAIPRRLGAACPSTAFR